jgi:hypothetical protein
MTIACVPATATFSSLRHGKVDTPAPSNANLKDSLMRLSLLTIALLSTIAVAHAGETPAPANAKVYFINLKDGDTVTSPVTIRFGLSGMGIAPAGTQAPDTGHHHLLIDTTLEGDALNEAIPMDEHHLHFGKGQTEAAVTLPKGKHTLQLVLGDWSHIPHKPPLMSERITVSVE